MRFIVIIIMLLTIAKISISQNIIVTKNGKKIRGIESYETLDNKILYKKNDVSKEMKLDDVNFLFAKHINQVKYMTVYVRCNNKLKALFEVKKINPNSTKILIAGKLSKIYEYSNEHFEEGFVINHNNDTLKTLVLNSKKGKLNYLCVITKNEEDNLNVFFAKDVKGYNNGTNDFISIIGFDDEIDFFVKQEEKGRISLYSRLSLPHDRNFLYFIKYGQNKEFHIINPKLNIVRHPSSNPNIFQSISYENYFKAIISAYMGDCKQVINKVNSKFYNAYELNTIVHEYNIAISNKNN